MEDMRVEVLSFHAHSGHTTLPSTSRELCESCTLGLLWRLPYVGMIDEIFNLQESCSPQWPCLGDPSGGGEGTAGAMFVAHSGLKKCLFLSALFL